MSYNIFNKSGTFLTFNIGGKNVSLPAGGSLNLVHDKHITNAIKNSARRGIITLVYNQEVGKVPRKIGKAEIPNKEVKKKSSKSK